MINYDFNLPRPLTDSEALYAALALSSTAVSFIFGLVLIWLLSRQASHRHVGKTLKMSMAVLDTAFVLSAGGLMAYVLATGSIGGLGTAGCTMHGVLLHVIAIASRTVHLLHILHQYATMVRHINYSYRRWQQICALSVMLLVALVCVLELAVPDTSIAVMPAGIYCVLNYEYPSVAQKVVLILVLATFTTVHNIALYFYVRVYQHMRTIKAEVITLAVNATAKVSARQKVTVAEIAERKTLRHSIVEFLTRLVVWIPTGVEICMGVAGVDIPPAFDCFVITLCLLGPAVTAVMTIRDDPTLRAELLLTLDKIKHLLLPPAPSLPTKHQRNPAVSEHPPTHRSTQLSDSSLTSQAVPDPSLDKAHRAAADPSHNLSRIKSAP
ncbi:hypothetical protein RI367_007919 [Sorochytrium milnesiophthora]